MNTDMQDINPTWNPASRLSYLPVSSGPIRNRSCSWLQSRRRLTRWPTAGRAYC